jgi:heat shock protein HslJ
MTVTVMDYKLSIFIAFLFFLSGCKSAGYITETIVKQLPENERFELVLFNSRQIVTPAGHEPVSVRFNNEERQLSGYSGCNRFFGSCTINNDSLSIGVIASTRMACTDMQLENKLLESLNNGIFKFQIDSANLILTSHKDTLIFRITSSDPLRKEQ